MVNHRTPKAPDHERPPIAPEAKIESNRVAIGAFADNGVQLSAPPLIEQVVFPKNME